LEKVLVIDGKQVKFKSTAAFAKRYKAQFQRNIFADFYKMGNAVSNGENGEEAIDFERLDIDLFYDIAWVLAKTADDSIPPVDEWLDTFEEFPIEEILPKLMDMVTKSIASTVASKKK